MTERPKPAIAQHKSTTTQALKASETPPRTKPPPLPTAADQSAAQPHDRNTSHCVSKLGGNSCATTLFRSPPTLITTPSVLSGCVS